MLMPVREYNKHIAKIPNCKMRRQWPALRASMMLLLSLQLLLLHLAAVLALEPAPGGGAGGGSASGNGGASPAGGGSGASGSGGPATTLIANLTEQGSPGVYNSTMAQILITCIWHLCGSLSQANPKPTSHPIISHYFPFNLWRHFGICWYSVRMFVCTSLCAFPVSG
ncbi:uncharacterized protein Dana_GF24208 [Drosophila ananassae]|uniref:Uncharacterized protein n=1 Tax=Drosophila ananassae TaxID=7217 RepID=B3MU65_DROAN|nr:uncharacterized protein LOC6506841 [Drosophila ananassae]XP_044572534.1 uncharacterized protein LOC6506841 [Drosophila ananassae]XP_044572535.1 uncharacterized protein LOC6506841 [Drosophila ananassae]XP_044572536.1 uncharacterized protein LOC6506841 [Drosophila ananassae]EDV33394.2 uncharacterized protein Dana_GF24208 [Drosophila ananassae]